MADNINISPEVAKLARQRARTIGTPVGKELARSVVIECVMNADDEAGLILNEEQAYSSFDELRAAFDVNDVVVNGLRFDVRAVDQEGRVSINRALAGTSYMTAGTLAVALSGALTGQVVGFVEAAQWQSVDRTAGDDQVLHVAVARDTHFDLVATLGSLHDAPKVETPSQPAQMSDLTAFVANQSQLPLQKQRAVIEYTLAHEETWAQLGKVARSWSTGTLKQVLNDASTWNSRVERIGKLLAAKFKHLSEAQIDSIASKVGETTGGQPESPAFRRSLLEALASEELSHSLSGAVLKKARGVVESVISGRSPADAVKEALSNKVAVQIANTIKQQRKKVVQFVDATAQELSTAFQQLALQPAYATHANDPSSGMESINEALKLLDAAELAQTIKDIDLELSNI